MYAWRVPFHWLPNDWARSCRQQLPLAVMSERYFSFFPILEKKKIFTGCPPILIGSILLLPQKYIKKMIKPDRYCFLWWPSHSHQLDNQIMKFMSGLWCCLLRPESFIIDFYRALWHVYLSQTEGGTALKAALCMSVDVSKNTINYKSNQINVAKCNYSSTIHFFFCLLFP